MTITIQDQNTSPSTAIIEELMDELFSWWMAAIERREYGTAAVLKDAESTVHSLQSDHAPEDLVPLCVEIFQELSESYDLVEAPVRELHGEIVALIGTLAKRHGL